MYLHVYPGKIVILDSLLAVLDCPFGFLLVVFKLWCRCFKCVLLFLWCLGQTVLSNCIDSWLLPSFLLTYNPTKITFFLIFLAWELPDKDCIIAQRYFIDRNFQLVDFVCSFALYCRSTNLFCDYLFLLFVCSLFPKAILFHFYFTLLQLVLCRVAAVKSFPVHHNSAGYIFISFGIIEPTLFISKIEYRLSRR